MDMNVATPSHDVPMWNETRWCGCWAPEAGVGVYMHAGRFRRDLDFWWCQLVAFLPDEGLCVDRAWGRNASDAGVRLGGLDLAMREDGWTAAFDGVGEVTTIDALARGPRGAGAPSARFGWDIDAVDAAPVWDMYGGTGQDAFAHGDAHIQQGCTTTGTLRFDGAEFALQGIGFKDHSSGPRTMADWHGHCFMLMVNDDFVAHLGFMHAPDGTPGPAWGAFLRDGRQHAIDRFECPRMEDPRGGPVSGHVEFEAAGETFIYDAELIHGLPMTITDANDNINGVAWEFPGDAPIFVEGKGRLTAPDGTVTYCYYERSRRRADLQRP